MTRTLAAPAGRVWRALTDPAALAAWFWPASFGTVVEADLQPGGRYRIAAERIGMAVSGEYVKIDPPHQVALTWQWDGEETATLVTVTLTPAGTGCTLHLRHEGFADPTERDNNAQGWSDCLDRLPAWLAG